MTRILLTGFSSFPGAPVNPTEAIVSAVQSQHNRALKRAGIDVRTAILPVSYAKIETAIGTLIAIHEPDVIIHLGLAARRKTVSIETRARNRLSIVHPDADGRFAESVSIAQDGTTNLPSRWPAARLAKAVSHAGYAAKPSIDAGDYLCNQALYFSLKNHGGLCGFIHVPKTRNNSPLHQITGNRNKASVQRPTLINLTSGVVAAIRLLAREHKIATTQKA